MSSLPRIVSLLPSATEIVCALGLESQLVGITHECDHPAAITHLPRVTASILPQVSAEQPDDLAPDEEPLPPTARETDEAVRQALDKGESLYRLDVDLLRSLKPDLVLTQGLCDVCAVNHKMVLAAQEALGPGVTLLDLAPTNLAQVLETFRQVGQAAGRASEAEQLIASVQGRWDRVREKVAQKTERPRTLLLEWPDPLFTAGHWNPELLTLAGATPGPWDAPGVPSRTLNGDEVRDFAPDVLVLVACGYDAYRALDEAYPLTDLPGWFDLPAVKAGDCYTVDGNAYFNRPGPRLAESAEILATILHPDVFREMLPPYSVQIFGPDLLEPEE